ncbi:glycoside hydrolase family 1 protein [Chloroflexota bacterium]
MAEQIQVTMNFPPGFLWGTATSSHQVEGGNHNQWTAWEDAGGRVHQNQQSGAACDWWNGRAVEDFDRAVSLHNNTLRLSIEWSRIEPEPGVWDQDALDHYRRMVQDLRARGLEPMVTLHHFTNPLWLEERGGWLNADAPKLFARYAARVVEALGEYVTLWCTINEPLVYAAQGYLLAYFPPGQSDVGQTLKIVVNLVRGHAAAYHAIKAIQPAAQVGLAKHQVSFRSFTPVLGGIAVRMLNYLFNEAIFGAFTQGRLRWLPGRSIAMPEAKDTLDWIGLQYYARYHVRFNPRQPDLFFFEQYIPEHLPHGPNGWGELAPEEALPRIKHIYQLVQRPIYVTEMGVPDEDDSIRPGYLARTLRAVWQACMHNYPVKGFYFWSLVDNFEWSEGYDPRFRFGLYGVDFATQERTEHRSARLYRAVCGGNALTADIVRAHAPEAFDLLFPQPEILDE